MFMGTACSRLQFGDHPPFAKPFCQCFSKEKHNVLGNQLSVCVCGEDHEVNEWHWDHINDTSQSSRSSWVLLSEDKRQVTFHPCYSSGTAAIRGDTPLLLNNHYYWEIKILTQMYGTDILVGVGTQKVNMRNNRFKFKSLLGQDGESYGLSYRGGVRHNGMVTRDCEGFCRGSIVGVRLDLWRGTLEFYVNRKPQGVAFYNLRRHEALYPMISSTAAQSCMRLTYAASWRASLLVDAAKILASSARDRSRLPPGLLYTARSQFWLTLPSDGAAEEEETQMMTEAPTTFSPQNLSTGLKRRHWQAMTTQSCPVPNNT